MAMKTVYQTCDGEIFEDRADAFNHEEEMFESWLSTLLEGDNGQYPSLPTVSAVVRHFNNSHHLTCSLDEFRGTHWEMLKYSLRTYWEDMNPDVPTSAIHPKRGN